MKKIFIFLLLAVSLTGFSQGVVIDAGTYTPDQLVNQILINSPCVSGTNVQASTGTDFGSTKGIGYFTNSNPNFPFAKGVVLTTGDVTRVPSPNNVVLSDGSGTWPGDTQLETILAAQGVNIVSKNATVLEFDFIPSTASFDFSFIFASEEYGQGQCNFSDAFAFLLTHTGDPTQNIAVINTNTPISVETIRDSANNPGCPSANPSFFGSYNGPGFGPAINFNGQTIELVAHATVIPGDTYHIKLVIADGGNNTEYDSAIFLEANSFNIGQDILPADISLCSNDPLPTITTQAIPVPTTYTWTEIIGTTLTPLVPAQTGSSLNLASLTTPPGSGVHTYNLHYVRQGCDPVDNQIVVTIYPPLNALATVPPIYTCNTGAPSYTVDLTKNTAIILHNNTTTTSDDLPATTNITYFDTVANANGDGVTGALGNSITLLSSESGKTIYARIQPAGSPCFVVRPFTLNIIAAPVVAAIPADITLCARNLTDNPIRAVFNLTSSIADILGSQNANAYTVTFHQNVTTATSGTNPITLTSTNTLTTPSREIWFRIQNISDGSCYAMGSFHLIVVPLPEIDIFPDVVVCTSYALPPLTYPGSSYYASANGVNPLAVGTVISNTQNIFVYSNNGTCSVQDIFKVTKSDLPSIAPASGTYCTSYPLPALPYGEYYEFPGGPTAPANSAGPYMGPVTNTGSAPITKTLYVFFEDTTSATPCTQEESFSVTIIPFTPLLQINYPNQFDCTSYTLPVTPGVTYYSGPGKTLPIIVNPVSTPGETVVYAFKETGTTPPNYCSSEVHFSVFIGAAQITAPADVESCSAYNLPPLAVGQYYHQQGAIDPIVPPVINSGINTVYISVPGQPCVNDVHFQVTVSIPVLPTFPNIGPVCDIYYLPNPNHTGHYYTQPGGVGTPMDAGDPIIGEAIHTIYFYDVLPSDNTCFVETSFTVEIFNSPPIDAKPVEVIQCNSCYTLDDLVNGEYYALAGGPTNPGNTLLAPGTQICTPGTTTIYVYAGATGPNTCFQEYSIDIINVSTTVNDINDISVCNSYTLPTIVGNGDYYELPGGPDIFGGNPVVPELTVITPTPPGTAVYTKTFYVYAQDNNRVACSDQDAFTVTIFTTPVIDPITPVTACDSYTLPAYNTFTSTPANAVNHYYTLTGGGAVAGNVEKFPGDVINGDATIFVIAQVGDANVTCFDEEPLVIDINNTPVLVPAEMQNVAACNTYTLPALTVGSYTDSTFSAPLANTTITGAGPHTIYVYAETATTPNCSVNGTFTVTITDTPVISPITPITACDSYTLPAYTDPMFTSTGAPITHYYTLPGGPTIPGGNPERIPGYVVNTPGTTTLYAYAETGTTPNCFSEEPFTITIGTTPVLVASEIVNVFACDTYTLPALTVGNYTDSTFSTPLANTTITGAGPHTIYVYAESTANPSCNVSATFTVTITLTPTITPADIATVNACNDYTLPLLTTPADSVAYYSGPNGSGTVILAGTNYTTNQLIYVHAVNGTAPNTCVSDASLTINVYNVDEVLDATVCGSYTLPALAVPGAGYYTATNGGGTPMAVNSSYTNVPGTYTLYVFGSNPAGTCTDESTFDITINDNPTATMPSAAQTTVCDDDGVNNGVTSFDLDSLTPIILGTQNPAVYEVKYYPSFPQAIAQSGALTTDGGLGEEDSQNPVFAVVTNISTPLCFTPIQINFTVVPKPESAPLSGVICVDGPTGQITPETIVSGYSSSLYNFSWTDSNGVVVSTAPNFTPTIAGTYELVISAFVNGLSGCDSDPIPVTVIQSLIPRAEDINFETTGWFTNNQTLTVIYNGDTSNLLYSLDGQEAQTSPIFTGLSSGAHEITVIDINGCGDAMMPIPVQLVNSPAYFTPNGDGVNDTWKIPVVSEQPGVQIAIYDRYGKLLKQLQVSQDWDGTFNGNGLPADDYWFTVNYVDPISGLPKEYRSHFSLVR